MITKGLSDDFLRLTPWVITVILLSNIVLRLLAHDTIMVLLWLNSLSNFLYLPSYFICLYSLVRREWGLAVLASLVIAFHIYSLRSYFSDSASAIALNSTFRIMSANLDAYSSETNVIVREIESIDPDIMALQEYTSWWHHAFIEADFFKKWPFSYSIKREDTFGSAILSKWSIIQADTFYLDEMVVPQTKALIAIKGKIITLINVHLLPPGIKHYSLHIEQQKKLIQLLRNIDNTPFVVAGDFNITEHSRFYSEVSKSCTNAFDTSGVGWGATWPNLLFPFPLLRIDHIFLSPDLTCSKIITGSGNGSDHRPLIATLGFRDIDHKSE